MFCRVVLRAWVLFCVGAVWAMGQPVYTLPAVFPSPQVTTTSWRSIELDTSSLPPGTYFASTVLVDWRGDGTAIPLQNSIEARVMLTRFARLSGSLPSQPSFPAGNVVYAPMHNPINGASNINPVLLEFRSEWPVLLVINPLDPPPSLHVTFAQTNGTTFANSRWLSIEVRLRRAEPRETWTEAEWIGTFGTAGGLLGPTTIRLGSTAGVFSREQWYRFGLDGPVGAAEAARWFEIHTGGSAADLMLGLYRSDGTLVAWNDLEWDGPADILTFGTGSGLLSVDAFDPPANGRHGATLPAGEYYACITGYTEANKSTTFGANNFLVTPAAAPTSGSFRLVFQSLADLNDDTRVDGADLAEVLRFLGGVGVPSNRKADLDRSGSVGMADVALLLGRLGQQGL